jgi:hypothetical protein
MIAVLGSATALSAVLEAKTAIMKHNPGADHRARARTGTAGRPMTSRRVALCCGL